MNPNPTAARILRSLALLSSFFLCLAAATRAGELAQHGALGDMKAPAAINIEIVENGKRFVPDAEHVFEDGLPAYGSSFVTQGYIYPAGTLTCTPDGCNGALPDGSAEFPHLVLGEWTCYGTHIGDGAHTVTGPWVVTTQLYSFGSTPGARTLVTSGYELPDVGVRVSRAITGGTGVYEAARGQQTQVFLGWNPSQGASLRVRLQPR